MGVKKTTYEDGYKGSTKMSFVVTDGDGKVVYKGKSCNRSADATHGVKNAITTVTDENGKKCIIEWE